MFSGVVGGSVCRLSGDAAAIALLDIEADEVIRVGALRISRGVGAVEEAQQEGSVGIHPIDFDFALGEKGLVLGAIAEGAGKISARIGVPIRVMALGVIEDP